MNPLYVLLLGIPTGIMHLYGSLGLQGRSLPARRLLLWGTLLGLSLMLYRVLPGPFGLHVPLFALTQILFVRFLGGGSWATSVLWSLVVNLSVPVGEGLIFTPVVNALEIPLKTVVSDPVLSILGGWLASSLLLLICVAVFIYQMRRERGRV